MKKHGFGWLIIMMALVLVCQGILPATNAQAEGDVIIHDLTAKSIFEGLGDALNYGTEEVEDIFFTNSYESSGEMTLDVEKVMNGRAF